MSKMIDELRSMGLEVDEGLDRVMGDEPLYEMMLGMFADSVQGSPIHPEDFDRGDLDGLTKQVHTLKGTAGNLGLTLLFEGYNQALTLLRAGKAKEAKAEYVKLLPVQTDVVSCIMRGRA